jgi:hypothetical protein
MFKEEFIYDNREAPIDKQEYQLSTPSQADKILSTSTLQALYFSLVTWQFAMIIGGERELVV